MPGAERAQSTVMVAGSELRIVEVVAHLPDASNTTVLARSDDDTLWVYKPAAGEAPLWDFPWRTLAAREALTYEVSHAMGLGVVPLTLLADGPYGPGSAQRYLDEDRTFDPRPLFTEHPDARLWPIAVLDIVTNNADRKVGHIFKQRGDDTLWAIDNGLTFHPAPKLRTVLWGFAGHDLPESLCEPLHVLLEHLQGPLGGRISELLGPEARDTTVARTRDLLGRPVHPDPPEDRPPLPWPVW